MPTDDLLATIRTALENEREALRNQLAEMGITDGDPSSLTYDTNFADTSQVTAERGEVAALANTLTEHLHDIDQALQKIDDGTYGTCERCDQEIPEARLEAMPVTRLCMNCASSLR